MAENVHYLREYCISDTKTDHIWELFESCFADPHCGKFCIYWKHCFIPAEGNDQVKLAFTCRGLKHTRGSTIWMQRNSECTFGGCNQLKCCLVQNETTDFGMCDEKWCNRLLRPYDTADTGGDGRTWVHIYLRTYLPTYLIYHPSLPTERFTLFILFYIGGW